MALDPARSSSVRGRALLALGCSVIFLLTSWLWTYLFNLVFALPFGLVAFFARRSAQAIAPEYWAVRWSGWLLGAGVLSALVALALFK